MTRAVKEMTAKTIATAATVGPWVGEDVIVGIIVVERERQLHETAASLKVDGTKTTQLTALR